MGVGGPRLAPLTSALLASWGCALPTCQAGDRARPRPGPCSVTAPWTRDALERSGWPPRVRRGPGRADPPACNQLTCCPRQLHRAGWAARRAPPAGHGGEGQGHSVSPCLLTGLTTLKFQLLEALLLLHPSWLTRGERGAGEVGAGRRSSISWDPGARGTQPHDCPLPQTREERRTLKTKASRETRPSRSWTRAGPWARGTPAPRRNHLPILPPTTPGGEGRKARLRPESCCRTNRRTSR